MFVSTKNVVKFAVRRVCVISPTPNNYLVIQILREYRAATKYQAMI